MSASIKVDFDFFCVECSYVMEGRYYPASNTSPAEFPSPRIQRCSIRCGESISSVTFDELHEDVRETVMEEIKAKEADWQMDESFPLEVYL